MSKFVKINLMKLSIGSDHAGYQLKTDLIAWLEGSRTDLVIENKGCYSKESCDYSDYAHAVAEEVQKGGVGILICGSANGVSIAANKHQGIRAALCWKKEIAELARQHNDANILSLPARYISLEEAKEMVNVFLDTPFEGGRHERRVNKIDLV
jgi:ribose 5-phosphate isomerase B